MVVLYVDVGAAVCSMPCVFFFKQKTAYEMRISDWSSDVCSSDLPAPLPVQRRPDEHQRARRGSRQAALGGQSSLDQIARGEPRRHEALCGHRVEQQCRRARHERRGRSRGDLGDRRSEEHTSELQSLMRISYAVFCLKKKKKT